MFGWKWPWTLWAERDLKRRIERERREREAVAARVAWAQRTADGLVQANARWAAEQKQRRLAQQEQQQKHANLSRDYRRQAVRDMAAQRVPVAPHDRPPRREREEPMAVHVAGPYHADDPYPAWLMQQAMSPLPPGWRVIDDTPVEPNRSCAVDSRPSDSGSDYDGGGSCGGDSSGGSSGGGID